LCSDGRKQNKPIENKRLCSKCKEKETRVKANQTESVCGDCLHAGILAKFKGAVNSHGMILPTDKVLVAFSGGPASRYGFFTDKCKTVVGLLWFEIY
jgi:cytoplasmic tRNA 2-thiolation protein 2